MPLTLSDLLEKSSAFIPHGHCYLWIPSLLWLHVVSDALIGTAYLGISVILYLLVRKIRLPFSPVFIAFGLFIGLCGLTHFLAIWTVWNPDYWIAGMVKAATAVASVATALGLVLVRPQVEEVVHAARLSEERRIQLESTNAELQRLNEKLREQEELKSQFFANMSHELRTPLALILGPAERMLNAPDTSPEQRRGLESIKQNGKALLNQVNALLEMARLEEGQKPLHYARVDLVPWSRRIAGQFQLAVENRGIRFELEAPGRLVAEVDLDMLERVLINLLSNAFKFTPQGGSIRVALASAGDRLQLCVEDSGPGVAAEQRTWIFQRFRQADSGATRRHGGTGLGLAIAKDFVELQGGAIEVDGSPAGGARFTVRLPLRAPASEQVSDAPEEPSPEVALALEAVVQEWGGQEHGEGLLTERSERPTVLLVEDTPAMRDFIAETLRDAGYNVALAADGREGLQAALALRPDLVVTDIMMPNMSGDQLLAALRGHHEVDELPVLLLSARADDAFRVRLLEEGAQDYLTKPFLPQELLARVGRLVQVKRAADALRSELSSASHDVEALADELAIRHRQLKASLELAEVAREQAERASEVKSHFLGLVSHELRTPLSTIILNAELLKRHPGAAPSDMFQAQVERTLRAGRQLSTMVEGLLEYTRFESGRTPVCHQAVQVATIAEEAVQLAQLQLPSPEVSLRLADTTVDLPALITDPRLLRVVLDNLLSNALKFTTAGLVEIRLGYGDGYHFFEVRDTGIGIARADLPRIFLPFEQLEPLRRKSIPGVGLGLALTKEIVQALGGKLEVESSPGEGSTFRVLLPSVPTQQQPQTLRMLDG